MAERGGTRDTDCQPSSCRSPTAKLVSIDRPVSGLSSGLLRALPASPSHACAQWVPDLADRAMRFHSTTVAGAAPESDRLPVLPEPALAGSPLEGRKVGNAGGHVKDAAVLCRLVPWNDSMPHSELLATALEAARAADDVVRHYYQRNLKITIKADKSPVTEADVETEKAIRAHIAARYPGAWLSRRGNRHLRARCRLRLVRRPDRRHQGVRARVPDVLDADRADAQGQAGGRACRRRPFMANSPMARSASVPG